MTSAHESPTVPESDMKTALITGITGQDASKPDGTPKKQLDVSRLAALGWRARIPLTEGLASTVADYARHGTSRN